MKDLQFSFENYRLCKLDFTLKEKMHQEGTIDINQTIQCQHRFNGQMAELHLTVRLDGDKSPFTIETTYLGVFKFNGNLDDLGEQKRKKNLHVNCAAVLFPFIRETIAETTRKAGLQPLLLSSFNFLKAFEDQCKPKE
jgi:preprotein translocase subunit SecB